MLHAFCGSFAKMKGLTCIVVFCIAVKLSEAKFVEGNCPTNVVSARKFKIKSYRGLWYTQFRTPFENHVHDCTSSSIFLDSENGYYMKTFSLRNVNKAPVVKRFVVYNDHRTGIFRTRPLGSRDNTIPVNNWVLDTDYKTYAVRFSCYNKSDMSHQVLSLQTRKRFPNKSLLNRLQIAASQAGFSLKTVSRVMQKHCPELSNPMELSEEEDSSE